MRAELIANRASVKHIDGAGDSFLHHTARSLGRAELAGVLLGAGVAVDAVNQSGDTALLDAVRLGNKNLDTVQVLLDAGADVNARSAKGRVVWKEAKGGKVKKVLKAAGALKK